MKTHLWDLGSNFFSFSLGIWAQHSQPKTLKLLISSYIHSVFLWTDLVGTVFKIKLAQQMASAQNLLWGPLE